MSLICLISQFYVILLANEECDTYAGIILPYSYELLLLWSPSFSDVNVETENTRECFGHNLQSDSMVGRGIVAHPLFSQSEYPGKFA